MFIREFEVSGFRSLRSVTLTDLGEFNVFYGENGVGKSNVLRAVELFGRIVASKHQRVAAGSGRQNEPGYYYGADLASTLGFRSDDYSWDERQRIELRGRLAPIEPLIPSPFDIRVVIDPTASSVAEVDWGGLQEKTIQRARKVIGEEGAFRIPSRRRLEDEALKNELGNRVDSLGSDLKRRLFWAAVSPDSALKDRFWHRLVPILRDEPLALGEPTPVGTSTQSVDVKFKKDGHEVSVADLGSGVQQLLLILGLSSLTDARVLALEEPEMNLSWSNQGLLKDLLEKMVRNTESGPAQLFVSSHSPPFAFDSFFDVTMENGWTKVERRPKSQLPYFGEADPPPVAGYSGQLLARNFVKVPDPIVQHLGLEPGQYVFFRRADDRVEILNESRFDDYLRADGDDGVDQ